MRPTLFTLCALCAGIAINAHGQTADEPNLGSTLVIDDTNEITVLNFSWWGKYGYHYIVETSEDLLNPWMIREGSAVRGEDAPISMGVGTNAPRYFLRAIQFDPNDVSGLADSDNDGLPDKWELYHFGNLDRDGSGDWNNDGLLDRDAFRFGLNPKGDDESQVAGKFDVFSYDARGWLDGMTLTGNASVSFGLDDEGNIETAN
jgi:hypothetical protein